MSAQELAQRTLSTYFGIELKENAARLLRCQENEEEHVSLLSMHRLGGHFTVPFHSDLLPYWEAFCEAHKNRNKLKTFRVNNIFIPPSPFFEQNLMPIFRCNVNLTSLELRSCGLECSEIVLVASFVEQNSSLSILDLSSNKIDSVEAAQSLSLAIKAHEELCFVNLSKCSLGENPAVLNAVLDGCKGLKSLLIDHNGIFNVNGGCLAVAEFLSSNATITVFSMANNVTLPNVIGDDQVKTLSQSLKKNTSLRHLCLGFNKLSLPSFLSSRRVTENLTHLDLTANNIGTQGAKLVARFLSQNQTLEELNLARNRINSHSASSLGSALKHNTTLRHLNLRHNSLTDRAVPAFVDAMKNNRTLLTLDLSGNFIKVRSGRKELMSVVCNTTNLHAVSDSNHTCQLILSTGVPYMNYITREEEMKNINALDNEGQKIRYKVVLALFTINKDLFNPRTFDDVPLELMPYLLEIVQQDVGYRGFGKGVVYPTRAKRPDPTLNRLYAVVTGWNTPLLVLRGPGKPQRKRKRKVSDEDDDEWTPHNRGSGF